MSIMNNKIAQIQTSGDTSQYSFQPQNTVRPNINPNVVGPRQAPIQHQPLQRQPSTDIIQQRQGPPPLRRLDSRGNILTNQPSQRPLGSALNQQPRPVSQQQPRSQPPSTWVGTPSPTSGQLQQPQQQIQQNRPPQTQGPNQANQYLQGRPPVTRTPGQHPVTAPNQALYRPPYPQQQQPRPSVALGKSSPNQNSPQNSTMSADILRSNISNNSQISINEDDDDVIIGHANTPQKFMKPPDPMVQSQYGSLSDDLSKKSTNLTTFTEEALKTNVPPNIEDIKESQNQSQRAQHFQNISSTKTQQQQEFETRPKPPMQRAMSRSAMYQDNEIKLPDPEQELRLKQPMQRTMSRNAMYQDNEMRQNDAEVELKSLMQIPTNRSSVYQDELIARPPEPEPSEQRPRPPVQRTMSRSNMNQDNEIRLNELINRPVNTKIKNEMNYGRNENYGSVSMQQQKKPENIRRNENIGRYKSKGDNDSGVDESTQGNERNGPESPGSPLKSPTKSGTSRPPSATPSNKSRSTSRSRTLIKTPEPETAKKVPMNKIQVGHAPSPNIKAVKSKIGSLENASYKPGGGNVKIETKKVEIKATPKIEAKNERYMPKGGDKKIVSTKLQWNAKSKIGSLENAHHKPGGGDKKIESLKTDFKDKAKPKVGSKDNVKHVPGGGDIKIQTHKLEIKAQSKIGSLDNVKHKPGGGDKKIFDDKEYLKNVEHPVALTSPSQSPVPEMATSSGADENLNQQS